MENGAQPAAGAHWIEKTPPHFRAGVIEKIAKNLSQIPRWQQSDDSRRHKVASDYEAKVFSGADNAEDYLRTIGSTMLSLEQKGQPAVQAAASDQQAQMGRHQMRPVHAIAATSSAATTPQTSPAANPPLPVRPPQLQQNTHVRRVNQAQPAKLPPVAAPVAQLHQTVVTQIQNSTQQLQPRMNHQQARADHQQSYQTHKGRIIGNVAITQARQCGGQKNDEQSGNLHPAGEVDWREDMFRKITSLKDAHLSELADFVRVLEQFQAKANGQLESLPKEQAAPCKYAHTIGRVKAALSFLQTQKANIPEGAKDRLDKWQTDIHGFVTSYRGLKARNAAKRQSQNCREPQPPQGVNISAGATDDSQQNHHEQHAAEALSHSSQEAPSGTPPTQQQNHSDHHLAGEAEDSSVRGEAESLVALNLPGDTPPFTGTACSQEIQQRHPGDEAIPQLTERVEPAGALPAQEQTHSAHPVCAETEDDSARVEAERPVGMEAAQIKRGLNALRSLSPAAIHSLASDMGVNLKRAFHHTTSSDTMDGSSSRMWFGDESSGKSCQKKRKTYGSVLDEIRATSDMLVETEIKIHGDDTAGGADGTMIELCYNAVSLAPKLREIICASEISTKLLVHGDYPMSSPVILGGDGEVKMGVPRVVDMAFRRSLGLLPEPRSIEGMAKTWDSVVRRAVVQFAHRLGGGPFSTRYGQW